MTIIYEYEEVNKQTNETKQKQKTTERQQINKKNIQNKKEKTHYEHILLLTIPHCSYLSEQKRTQ